MDIPNMLGREFAGAVTRASIVQWDDACSLCVLRAYGHFNSPVEGFGTVKIADNNATLQSL